MTNLSPAFCQALREARRKEGLSQSALAGLVGCKQSALSAFEQGDGTKLNEEVIQRLASRFGLKFPPDDEAAARQVASVARPVAHQGFCPNPHCPTNHVYHVESRALARPDREAADPVGGTYCAVCGEVLERACPNCGAAVHDGAVCSYCGEAYVTLV